MSDNIFVDVSESVRDMLMRQASKVKRLVQPKSKDDEDRLVKNADELHQLINDPRYPRYQRYLQELLKQLDRNLDLTLTSFPEHYSREARADKAAAISAQKQLLKAILEHPEEIAELIRSKGAQ